MIWSRHSIILLMVLAALQFVTAIGVTRWKIDRGYESIPEKINEFSFKLFEKMKTKKNLVFSPLSVWTTLSMALLGSDGETRNELLTGLDLKENSLNISLPEVRKLIRNLNGTHILPAVNDENKKISPGVELRLSNKMFVKEDLEVNEIFKRELNDYHKSLPTSLDFTKSKQASETINDWVAEQTNNRITNLIDPSSLDQNTAIILINTLYFKGDWVNQFYEEDTKLRNFHLTDEDITKVPMMTTSGYFKYRNIPKQHISFIELPYKNEEDDNAVSMFIVIPDKVSNFNKVQKNLRNLWLNDLRIETKSNIELSLPKFIIETSIDLQSSLEKLGMKKLFEDSANFSRIAKEPMKVSKISQKVFIEVNEKGTEATGATEINVSSRSIPHPVNVNKPFLFLICTKEVILFSGRIVDPRQRTSKVGGLRSVRKKNMTKRARSRKSRLIRE